MKRQLLTKLLFLSLLITLACSNKSRPEPAKSAPPAGNQAPPATQPTSSKIYDKIEEDLVKSENLLKNMGCKIGDIDIYCMYVNNYKRNKDLKLALNGYSQALKVAIDDPMVTRNKQNLNALWISSQKIASEIDLNKIDNYDRDLKIVKDREEIIKARGFYLERAATVLPDGTTLQWKMAIARDAWSTYTRAQLREELSAYVRDVNWFLAIYDDGQNALDQYTIEDYRAKLELARRLLATDLAAPANSH